MQRAPLELTAFILVLIGALNVGLVSLLKFDIVQMILGTWPTVVTIVNVLIGASAIFIGYVEFFKK